MIALSQQLVAQATTDQYARELAMDFFHYRMQKKGMPNPKINPETVQTVYQSSAAVTKPVLIFQQDSGGFVVMSQQDEQQFEVTGYSDNGVFDPGNIPPQLQTLIRYYEDSLVVSEGMDVNNVDPDPYVTPMITMVRFVLILKGTNTLLMKPSLSMWVFPWRCNIAGAPTEAFQIKISQKACTTISLIIPWVV
jgi:hypothetical protein